MRYEPETLIDFFGPEIGKEGKKQPVLRGARVRIPAATPLATFFC